MYKARITELFNAAFIHMKKLMFENFNVSVWLYFLVVTALSGTFFGFKINTKAINEVMLAVNNPGTLEPGSSSTASLPPPLLDFIRKMDPSALMSFLVFFLIFVFALSVLMMVAGSVCRYMGIASVIEGRIGFREFWSKYKKQGIDYFWFITKIMVLFTLLILLASIVLALCSGGFASLFSNGGNGAAIGGTIVVIIVMSLLAVAVFFAMAVFFLFVANFMVPAVIRHSQDYNPGGSPMKLEEAGKILWAKSRDRKGDMFAALMVPFVVFLIISSIFGFLDLLFTGGVIAAVIMFKGNVELLLLVVLIAFLFIYMPVLLVLNAPAGVFVISLQILMFSWAFPEYALLMPLRDASGKVIGAMSYSEHLRSSGAQELAGDPAPMT